MTGSGDPTGPIDRGLRPGDGSLAGVLSGAIAALGDRHPSGSEPARPGSSPRWLSPFADPLGLAERLDGVRQVVVLLVDGLGYALLPRAAQAGGFLAETLAGEHRGRAHLDRLECAFPSTTPTSLVTLGTGAQPGAHGVLGFTVAVPGTEQLLTHVLWRDDPDPPRWQPVPALLARAAAAGLRTAMVSRDQYRGSGLTRAAWGDLDDYRDGVGYRRLARALVGAVRDGAQVVVGYHPDLDTVMHRDGLTSDAWLDAARDVGRLIETVARGLPDDAALLVTADHGGLDVPAADRIDCTLIPELLDGVRLIGGEPRARYVYTRPGATAEVRAAWQQTLGADALVLTRDEIVAAGWFGPTPPAHADRIGDVVAVCLGTNAVLASGWDPPLVADLIGMHGSIRPEEVAVPLLTLRGG